MTDDVLIARNRANAQNSTGPKTEAGKTRVAGNARRHGATSRPDPDYVATWLAIILDRPKLTSRDLLPEDDAGYRALALAEAEVRFIMAQQALQEFEARCAASDEITQDLREVGQGIMQELIDDGGTKREVRSGTALMDRILQHEAQETHSGGKRHRLLKRYLAEAKAQRRKALAAWLAVAAEGGRGRLAA